MAGRVGNKTWLRQQLQKALQWDAEAAEAVCEAVSAAGSRGEVDELVEAYMGGSPAARKLVEQFMGPQGAAAAATAAPPPGMQMLQRGGGAGGGASGSGAGGSRPGGGGGGASGSGRAPPLTVELAPPADKPKPQLYMGPNVRVATAAPKPRKGRGGGGGAGDPAAGEAAGGAGKALAKPVINCLRCGKIYDCHGMSDEARRFLESGGLCTFCGTVVTLRYADGSTNAGAAGDAGGSGGAAAAATTAAPGAASGAGGELAGFKPEAQQGNTASSVGYNDSAAAALALKDRLVEYDRESAKRTTVYDDQSDFFAIDSNAWLTDEERAVLKQRERDMAEAEEARRKRVTVSFDLLGRKVVLEEGQVPGGPEEAAAVEAQLEAARAAAAARTAAAATAAEAAQGGDAAAPTALAAVEDKLRDLRITVNPSMAARHFVFLPQQAQQQQGQQREQHAAAHRQRPAAGGGHAAGDGQPQGRHGGSSSEGAQQQQQGKQGRGHSRLQHDDSFDDWMPADDGGIDELAAKLEKSMVGA